MPARMRHALIAFDAIERIEAATSLQQVLSSTLPILSEFEISSILIAALPPQSQGEEPIVLLDGTPKGWLDFYRHETFYPVDHIVAHARMTKGSFEYREIPYERDPGSGPARLMSALSEYGMSEGLMIPGRFRNIPSGVAVSGQKPFSDPSARHALEIIAYFAKAKARTLLAIKDAPPLLKTLTGREREVLKWIAVGKTSWDVGALTGVSERSVNKIIASAMKKLNAVSRTQAVVNAIRVGEIAL